MKEDIEFKLQKIADIWNYFIWDYRYCSSKIKFNDDVKTNYFGEILGYFQDTLDIVFETNGIPNKYADKFSHTISFLQAIYIQQDFIEEMLGIFKTAIDKGHLKKDSLYSINRDLRNELIGHPIRKYEGKIISSTLFSYEAKENEIQYIRYRANNNFQFEIITHSIIEIQQRHMVFLEKYFDLILLKLKAILDDFLKELDKLETVIEHQDFVTVLKLVELYFEAIFKSDYVYDKESLLKIYGKKEEHLRYQNFIDWFYKGLKSAISDKKNSVAEIYEIERIEYSEVESPLFPEENSIFSDPFIRHQEDLKQKVTYHYELGKLGSRRNSMDFNFFSSLLRTKCKQNELILGELKHMESNLYNDIEYYTAFKLICVELSEE